MLAIDEDLRYGRPPAGASDHLVAPRRFFDNIDFGIGDAFALQQHAGAGAIGAEHCRVKLDFSHSGGDSKLRPCGRAYPSIKTTTSECQAGRCAATIPRRATPGPMSKPRPMRPPPA